jgi:hypothetical protein
MMFAWQTQDKGKTIKPSVLTKGSLAWLLSVRILVNWSVTGLETEQWAGSKEVTAKVVQHWKL